MPVILVELDPSPGLVVDGVHPHSAGEFGGLEECFVFEEGHGFGVVGVEPDAGVGAEVLEFGGGDGH